MKTLILLLLFSPVVAVAQTSLGTVADNGSVGCPSGFQAKASCRALTVSCGTLPDLNVTIGEFIGSKGLVILANGSTWTTPGLGNYAASLDKAGYSTVLAQWDSAWQAGGDSILAAACRPATLVAYEANGQDFGAVGASGGAGALVYGMSWYGVIPKTLEFTSGPVYSDIFQGCESPRAPNVEVTPTNGTPWSNTVYYNAGVPALMSEFTGQPCEPRKATTQGEDQIWLDQSILAPGALLSYPTYISVWLCETAQQPNNSAGQAYLWLQQVTSPWNLTAITGCSGSEGTNVGLTPQGVNGETALLADLEANF